MTDSKDARKLTLVDDFNVGATDAGAEIASQAGYQKVDDVTVLERKLIPIFTSPVRADSVAVRVDVYDFNGYTVTSYLQSTPHEDTPRLIAMRNFSEVEGKQSIRDAHRALTELGGSPPPIDDLMGYIMELGKDVSISAPLKLKVTKP